MRPTSPRIGVALLVALGVVLGACGGGRRGAPPVAANPVAAVYTATRWIPARPTYAIGARTVREAQRGALDVLGSFGALVDVDAAEVSAALRALLLVDPLSPDALASIGIDLDGGLAVFSEDLAPTVVVHLAAPAQFQAFLERQDELRTHSVVVDGTEVFTAVLPGDLRLSWAVADDWLWLHVGLPGQPDTGTRWFSSSRRPGAPTWTADWTWAQGGGRPAVVGFIDLRAMLAALPPKVADAAACAQLLEPVGRVALAVEGDARSARARVALDVGAAAQTLARATLPVPEGWAAAAARVPLAVQWNLDLPYVRQATAPCARTLGIDLSALDAIGVRTARALLRSFDPDDRSGTGAVALDLAHERYFAARLDDIPLRSALERKRQFGPLAGRSLAVPMFLTIDYVLTDTLALAAVGDGLLAAIVGQGGSQPGPVFALDVQPLGLSREAWEALLELVDAPHARRVVERLLAWREARISLAIDGSRLVLAASGTRR